MRLSRAGILPAPLLVLGLEPAYACATCRPTVKAQLYDADFFGTFLLLLLPVAIMTIIGIVGYFSDDLKSILRRP